jgi:uncharacterized protein with HEPN domain
MPSDPRKLLYDIGAASRAVRTFCRGRDVRDLEADHMLRSACERQFEIIGEAMTRLHDRRPGVFSGILKGRTIIAFQNPLIHRYDTVDSEIVWDVIQGKAERRMVGFRALLRGSVEVWAREIDKLGLRPLPGRRDLFAWDDACNPDFLGYMAGVLRNQQFLRDGGAVV